MRPEARTHAVCCLLLFIETTSTLFPTSSQSQPSRSGPTTSFLNFFKSFRASSDTAAQDPYCPGIDPARCDYGNRVKGRVPISSHKLSGGLSDPLFTENTGGLVAIHAGTEDKHKKSEPNGVKCRYKICTSSSLNGLIDSNKPHKSVTRVALGIGKNGAENGVKSKFSVKFYPSHHPVAGLLACSDLSSQTHLNGKPYVPYTNLKSGGKISSFETFKNDRNGLKTQEEVKAQGEIVESHNGVKDCIDSGVRNEGNDLTGSESVTPAFGGSPTSPVQVGAGEGSDGGAAVQRDDSLNLTNVDAADLVDSVRALCTQGEVESALEVVRTDLRNISHPQCAAILHEFALAGRADCAQAALLHMQVVGVEVGEDLDTAMFGELLLAYAKDEATRSEEGLDQAFAVLELMSRGGIEPDLACLNRLMEACSSAADCIDTWQRGLRLLETMRQFGVRPTIETYNTLLEAVGRRGWSREKGGGLDRGAELLARMAEDNVTATTDTFNMLMYGCAWAAGAGDGWGGVERGLGFLESMAEVSAMPDVITFNNLIAACAQAAGSVDGARARDQAFRLLETMRRVGLSPDQGTCDTLIATCAKAAAAGDPDGTEYGLRVLGMMAEQNITADPAMRNALIGECLRTAEECAEAADAGADLEGGLEGETLLAAAAFRGWYGVEWVARALGAMEHHLAAASESPLDPSTSESGEAVGRRLYQRLATACLRHVKALVRGAELPDADGDEDRGSGEVVAAVQAQQVPAESEVVGVVEKASQQVAAVLEPRVLGGNPMTNAAAGSGVGINGGDGIGRKEDIVGGTDANGAEEATWWDGQGAGSQPTLGGTYAPPPSEEVLSAGPSRTLSPQGRFFTPARQQSRPPNRWPAYDGFGGGGPLRRRETATSAVVVVPEPLPPSDVRIEPEMAGSMTQEVFARLQRLAALQLQDLRNHIQDMQASEGVPASEPVSPSAVQPRALYFSGYGTEMDAHGERTPSPVGGRAGDRDMPGLAAGEEFRIPTPLSQMRNKVMEFSQTMLNEIEQLKEQQEAAEVRAPSAEPPSSSHAPVVGTLASLPVPTHASPAPAMLLREGRASAEGPAAAAAAAAAASAGWAADENDSVAHPGCIVSTGAPTMDGVTGIAGARMPWPTTQMPAPISALLSLPIHVLTSSLQGPAPASMEAGMSASAGVRSLASAGPPFSVTTFTGPAVLAASPAVVTPVLPAAAVGLPPGCSVTITTPSAAAGRMASAQCIGSPAPAAATAAKYGRGGDTRMPVPSAQVLPGVLSPSPEPLDARGVWLPLGAHEEAGQAAAVPQHCSPAPSGGYAGGVGGVAAARAKSYVSPGSGSGAGAVWEAMGHGGLRRMSVDQVCVWLGSVGLGELESLFREAGIDGAGLAQLRDLQERDVQALYETLERRLGVPRFGQVLRLAGAIQDLPAS